MISQSRIADRAQSKIALPFTSPSSTPENYGHQKFYQIQDPQSHSLPNRPTTIYPAHPKSNPIHTLTPTRPHPLKPTPNYTSKNERRPHLLLAIDIFFLSMRHHGLLPILQRTNYRARNIQKLQQHHRYTRKCQRLRKIQRNQKNKGSWPTRGKLLLRLFVVRGIMQQNRPRRAAPEFDGSKNCKQSLLAKKRDFPSQKNINRRERNYLRAVLRKRSQFL